MTADPDPEAARREALRELAENRWIAHRRLFAHRHTKESAEAHEAIVGLIHSRLPRQGIEGFRGIGKSTLLEEGAIIRKCYGEFNNMVILGASYTRAVDRLSAIKREFTINPLIPALFGALPSQPWQEAKIVFTDGSCIQAIGRGQSMAGIKHYDWRPDAALVDDLEDPEELLTDPERDAAWNWFLETFIPSLSDPVSSWIRVLGTRRGKGALMERIEDELGWPVAKFPIEHPDPASGERVATWPGNFPLEKIDQIKRLYRGKMDVFEQEFMCQATGRTSQSITRAMIRVVPRARSYEAVYGFIDPAFSTSRGMATTGWAVWSWVHDRLVVWGGGADRLLPDQIVALAYRVLADYDPVWLGVERDVVSQFLMQPLRQEATRRGLAFVPIKPVLARQATGGRGKIPFISGLQPLFAAGEVEFAVECPDLRDQLLSFPHGPIDAPNALAYAQLMRPGLLVYEDFGPLNIAPELVPSEDRPLVLAGNADGGLVTALLVQFAEGNLKILADWVMEGTPEESVAQIAGEASLLAEGGEWREKIVYDPDQPLKVPERRAVFQRFPLDWIVPGKHRNTWSNVGLLQAIRRIPSGSTASDLGDERGRPALARMLREHHRGRPRVLLGAHARWSLRAFAGGYSRPVGAGGVAAFAAEAGPYRTLMEGLESFCAFLRMGQEPREEADGNYRVDQRSGQRYLSAMPLRR